MKNIFIDITRAFNRRLRDKIPTGIDRVTLEYIRRLADKSRALVKLHGHYYIFSEGHSRNLFTWLLTPASGHIANIVLARMILKSLINPVPNGCFLLNISHTELENPKYTELLKKLHIRPIFMIHDLLPISHPEYHTPLSSKEHIARIHSALSSAAGIICNSQATLNKLTEFAFKEMIPMPTTTVALLGAGMSSSISSIINKRPIDLPYFVILGTIEPRKNHYLLLQIWRKMAEQYTDKTPRLVIIGHRGWECENAIDMLERCSILKDIVIECPNCCDDELVTYLKHAQALLFPSFCEGYGLPLVEALSLGVPVVASDLDVFHEIAGDVPEYIDPLDGRQWEEIVHKFSSPESPLRIAQMKRMKNLKLPTWDEHFTKVNDLIDCLSTKC